jgi:hypothetical protein
MNKRLGTSIAPTRNGSKSGNKEFITQDTTAAQLF